MRNNYIRNITQYRITCIRQFLSSLIFAFCFLLSACGSDKEASIVSPSPTTFANPTTTVAVPPSQNSPVTPTPFNLIQKLQAQGINVASAGTDYDFTMVTQVDGNRLMVNGEYLTFFEFPNAEAANVIYVSPEGATFRNVKGATVNFSPAKIGPHVYKKDNLIVLYVGNDQTLLDALKVVMGNQIAGV